MEDIKKIFIAETDSTNNYLYRYQGEEGLTMTVVWTNFQTAGRGQGTNSWESEKGKNLTFSIKTKPLRIPAIRQYVMLEAGALAVKGVLSEYMDDITIKWPNDIYWRDYKISGTLSICTIHQQFIKDCIIGTGININQRKFVSDAPNPISIYQITGKESNREQLLDAVLKRLKEYLIRINSGQLDYIHDEYKANLFRRSGIYRYEDKEGVFLAEIADIEENGHIVLRRSNGHESRYAFKEVKFIF